MREISLDSSKDFLNSIPGSQGLVSTHSPTCTVLLTKECTSWLVSWIAVTGQVAFAVFSFDFEPMTRRSAGNRWPPYRNYFHKCIVF